ncbi:NAD(P)H-dependent glycerol-3-phosphate dehydrogenase [Hansschlegelia zhihuaiae]|uniref:Glycerol-3-phosphate dehydrogenase [NAD(P)+] n=1 Tax=Hansschlegelia zhihuaiae TaxID=405005 RepID=A0A4V1KJC1_9HYPH|nr:NAD(P)H-dependent glycerol-3-phosphate dehydrogenase [Hansschlegelia zhihuaiae]RXF73672.1 NAD(P)-dependent glycerol-3-phosphate dehydrogenase [Hansschlegelia zhihuaiae]
MSAPATTVAVVGAGAWGTALANVAAEATGATVPLIGRDAGRMAEVERTRVNAARLPHAPLQPGVRATAEMASLSDAEIVLLVVPTQTLRGVAAEIGPHLAEGAVLVACCKGVERGALALPHAVLGETLPGRAVALLSGPSFADDVARGLPTAVTLACAHEAVAERVAEALATRSFRPYRSTDVVGVALGGAAKNVLAIAAGVVEGRGLGASAVAALIARGFAELARLGAALGARPETLSGLSGLGDLVLTATSPKSRNFSLGLALGRGEPPPQKLAEGAATAAALVSLASAHDVEMPISSAVAEVVADRLTVSDAIERLLARPLRAEG